jgi:hypothetical protein
VAIARHQWMGPSQVGGPLDGQAASLVGGAGSSDLALHASGNSEPMITLGRARVFGLGAASAEDSAPMLRGAGGGLSKVRAEVGADTHLGGFGEAEVGVEV